jgi:hypothetical protein
MAREINLAQEGQTVYIVQWTAAFLIAGLRIAEGPAIGKMADTGVSHS